MRMSFQNNLLILQQDRSIIYRCQDLFNYQNKNNYMAVKILLSDKAPEFMDRKEFWAKFFIGTHWRNPKDKSAPPTGRM